MAIGATGKRKLILDLDSVDLSSERDPRFWIVPPDSTHLDLFRYTSYNIWGRLRTKNQKPNLNRLYSLAGRHQAPYTIEPNDPVVLDNSILPLAVQRFTIRADRSKFNGAGWSQWWTKYIKGGKYSGAKQDKVQEGEVFPGIIQDGVEFTDHAFELMSPFEEEELGIYANVGKPVQIKIEPVYNFFNKRYEIRSNSDDIPETMLPNLYIFTSYGESGLDAATAAKYAEFITLRGRLPATVLSMRGDRLRKGYYDQWSSAMRDYKVPRETFAKTREWLSNRGSTTALPLAEAKKFNHYSEARSEFPMYMDISFSTDKKTKFADMLEESKLDVAFMSDVMKETIPNIANEMLNHSMIEMRDNPVARKTDMGGTVLKNNPTVTQETRKALDITGWLTKFIDFNEETLEMELADTSAAHYELLRDRLTKFATFLGTTLDNDSIVFDRKFEPLKRLMTMIFSGKLRRLVKENFRTFEEMLAGKLAYSETVLYRIAKLDANGTLIQNIYIPNSSDIDIFKFVDTQVKYGKDYIYSIYAYQAVIGTKYEYFDLLAGWRDHREMRTRRGTAVSLAKFSVAYEPSIKLFEIPYHNTRRIILDVPPLVPDAEFVPYRGKEDRIQIRLNGMLGSHEAKPIIIEPDDAEHISRLQRFTLRAGVDDPIPFFRGRGDDLDFVSYFQIFRTTEKPKSYLDFRGHLHSLVDTNAARRTPQKANSAEMIDLVEPNQKYYYLFRAVDYHGHISNPTDIYEVEMVEQKGSVYSVISAIEFVKPEKVPTKSMRRYLHIKPNIENGLIDREPLVGREEANDIERVNLGIGDERVWGKKFKIRLTSKNSGKKIDFNLNFATKHIKPGNR